MTNFDRSMDKLVSQIKQHGVGKFRIHILLELCVCEILINVLVEHLVHSNLKLLVSLLLQNFHIVEHFVGNEGPETLLE